MRVRINKYALYKGRTVFILAEEDGMYLVDMEVKVYPSRIPMDFLLKMSRPDQFMFSGHIRKDDPDLFICENGIVGEEYVLFNENLVKFRCAKYKRHDITVGARNDTHHFVTYHSDTLQPCGVLPDWLPFATQTAPQDFMGKIPINDPELIFT